MSPPSSPTPSDGQRRDPRLFLGAIVLVGYVFAAKGVRNFYPLSEFPMYAGRGETSAARIMVRVDGGPLREIEGFTGWSCPALPAFEGATCGGARGIPYIEHDQAEFVRQHPLQGRRGERVELVRRVFSFDAVERPVTCSIGFCEAVP